MSLGRGAAVALALCAFPALVQAALGPRYGGELRVGLASLPARLAAAVPGSAAERFVLRLAHETLVEIGAHGRPEPGLAAALAGAAGGREWTLELPEDARFHDGAPLAADDAVRSLRRFLERGSPAAARLREALEADGLLAPDARHVVLRLLTPAPSALAALASPAAAITSASGAGCGPFVPAVNVPGQRLALTAFRDHVRGRPYLDSVVVLARPEPALRRAELRSGRLDGALDEPGPGVAAATLLLLLDATRRPFDDPVTRRSLGASLDRQELARLFLPGGQATDALLSPALLPAAPPPPSAAGTAAGRGAITLAVDDDVPPTASQRVLAHLDAAGFAVSVRPLPRGEAAAAPAHARLFLFSPEVPDPVLALRELALLRPPVLRALEALAAAEGAGEEARPEALARAEAALREDGVLLGLGALRASLGLRDGVRGVRVDPAGRTRLEDAWLLP